MENKDIALRRLDIWYSNRLRRNYTPESAKEAIVKINDAMRKDRELSDLVTNSLLSQYSSENMLRNAKNYWSQQYSTSEDFSLGLPVFGINLNDVPKKIREEYLEPIFDNFNILKGFVDKVRFELKVDKNLYDVDIDRLFIAHYGSIQKFIEYSKKGIKLIPAFVFAMSKNISKDVINNYSQSLKIAEAAAPILLKSVYRDLDS